MKKISYLVFPVVAGVALAACQPSDSGSAPVVINSESSLEEKVSYGLGYGYAEQLLQNGVALDVAAFSAGFTDASAEGASSKLTEEELQAAFEEYTEVMQQEAAAAQEAQAGDNLAQANAFLEENAGAEGVMTTESGLQYKVIEEGTGETPSVDSQVQVHYEGRLLDGTIFDSSIQRGEPVVFGVNQVIPGWTEALQMMPEGSTWQLYVPPNLGYGPADVGFGPNQLLIFDVELLQANYEAPEEVPAE